MNNKFASTTRQELINMIHQYKHEVDELNKLKEYGYVIAMRLLQGDVELDDAETSACAEFAKPEIILSILRGTHEDSHD